MPRSRWITSFLHILLSANLLVGFPAAAAEIPYGGWDAVWSPDGSQIAFIAGSPHRSADLWVMDSVTGQMRQLTRGGASAPIWSSDGRRIYFTGLRHGKTHFLAFNLDSGQEEKVFSWLPEGARDLVPSPDETRVAFTMDTESSRDLWIARRDGTEQRRMTSKLAVRYFVWTRDSKRVLFVPGRVIGTGLWSVSIDDAGISNIYNGYAGTPSVSPDGKWVAFPSPAGGNPHVLRLVSLETGKDRSLGILNADDGAPAWFPDSSRILYSGKDKDGFVLWSVGIDGKGITRLSQPGMCGSRPMFSPDGKQVLYVGYDKQSSTSDLFLMNPDNRSVRRLTTSPTARWQPVWSPDGRKIAYLCNQGRRNQVWLQDAARGTTRPLAPVVNQEGTRIIWSPKQDSILTVTGGTVSLVRLTADPKKAVKAFLAGDQTAASWFPDGSSLALVTWRNNAPVISRSTPDGSEPRELTRPDEKNPAGDFFPAVSPDGKRIAFARGGEIRVIDADGANPKVIARPAAGEKETLIAQWPIWSSDGTHILYALARSSGDGGTWEIRYAAVADDSDKLIYSEPALTEFALFREFLTSPPILTRDGKRVIFTSDRETGVPNIWTVNTDGTGLAPLTSEGGIFPSLSPDGKKLAYTSLGDRSEENRIIPLK